MQMISPDPRDTTPTIRAASASPRAPVHETAQLVSPKYKKLIRCESSKMQISWSNLTRLQIEVTQSMPTIVQYVN